MAALPGCILISPRPVQAFEILPSLSPGSQKTPPSGTTLNSVSRTLQDLSLPPACHDWLPVLTPQPAYQPACWQSSPKSASLRKGPSLNGKKKHLQIPAHISLHACEMGQWPLSLGKGQPTQAMTDELPCYRILASLVFTLGATVSDR